MSGETHPTPLCGCESTVSETATHSKSTGRSHVSQPLCVTVSEAACAASCVTVSLCGVPYRALTDSQSTQHSGENEKRGSPPAGVALPPAPRRDGGTLL